MSLMYYIGANRELPLGEFNINAFDEESNNFDKCEQVVGIFVQNLNHENKIVKEKFRSKNVYRFSANWGNFFIDKNIKSMNIQRFKINKMCISTLLNYIDQNLSENEEIEIYTCWYGEEGEEKNSYLNSIIYLNKFKIEDNFEFKEKQYILIRR